ncbi:hypothetical protein SLNWT_5621 [Streptomyces albus]|uniref:Uncharacterized protein n=1 Tax=Streptomyces albus (strain ATCC 21838 / DSM 41398 / FERM P-419 / JCM 4703 / NBRC 107858) TaxID=1081613 RepID=A0A0B5F6N9_STRA4|nr:hypothetical protein SLNWT_5621 [Streptomyces albus]AOU80299.1 hypothetical protein SLNHY_5608 [Streptomyces albus]AYN36012.1 hypothetical protein DUI70_5516 [Streptomyces albus]
MGWDPAPNRPAAEGCSARFTRKGMRGARLGATGQPRPRLGPRRP